MEKIPTNILTAKEAYNIFIKVNKQYNDACERFSVKNEADFDVEAFKEFIFDNIKTFAENGCMDFEFEVNVDLIKLNVVQYFKDLGYRVAFYELDSTYSDHGYNLYIGWHNDGTLTGSKSLDKALSDISK